MLKRPGFVQVLFAPDGPGGSSSGQPSGSGSSGSSSASGSPSNGSAGATPSAPSSPSGASPASAPSSAPSPESTVAPGVPSRPGTSHDTPSGAEPDTNLDDLLQTLEGVGYEVEVPAQPKDTPTAATPPTPAPAPAAQPEPVPAAPQPTPAAAPAPAAPAQPGAQPPQGTRPPLDPADPRGLADALATHEAAAIDEVAKTYQFTNEEVEALGLEPAAAPALTKIMATVQVRTMQEMLRSISTVVPAMVQRVNAVQKSAQESMDAFFTRWPDIPRDKAGDITRLARTYRQNNPSIPREQMIEEVGQMVMVMHRIQPRQAAPAAAPHGQPVPVAVRGNGAAPSVFTPAIGGMPGSPQQSDSGNDWMWLDPQFSG